MGHRGSDLRRRPPTKSVKRRFYIYCEGRNTEPDYFRAMKTKVRGALIELRIKPEGKDPETMASAAEADARRIRSARNSYEQDDQVWCVFDHDGRHEPVHKAREICHAGGVGIAFSNPCFEVWLLLHYDDYNKACDSKQAQCDLEPRLPGYDKNRSKTADFTGLIASVKEAETRAERQLARREEEGNPNGAPSTTVVHLTRAIATAAAQFRRPA